MSGNITVADLFCGAGGLTTGVQFAARNMGIQTKVIAVNHWEIAIATHKRNHPEADHYCASIDQLDPRTTTSKLDVLVAAPECFPSETLILCSHGLIPIEQVKVGDLVMTHLNRWRRVTHTMQSTKDTIILRGHGHYGLETTPEHPFYARTRRPFWAGSHHENPTWEYTEPIWQVAQNMPSAFWGSPTTFASLDIPPIGGRGVEFTESFWWLVGRWLGDGSLTLNPAKRRFEITISCGFHEADKLFDKLSFCPPQSRIAGHSEFRWRTHQVRTGVLFESAHKGLALWLAKHFGKLAHGKKMPTWVFSMSKEWRQALLDGYMSADGCFFGNRKFTASSVSKSLALGIRLLAQSLGNQVALHRRAASAISNQIEGRTVNVRDQYEVAWVKERKHQYGYSDDSHTWLRVREIEPGHKNVPVYNLSVEEDESYVADGIVVHNCIFHSRARGGRPINDQRRASAFHVLRWMELFTPHSVLIENVPEFAEWSPLGSDNRPLKSRKGETFRAFIGMIESLGYHAQWRVLNCADYGDVTTRERLFIIARRGRRPIRFPEPTHSATGAQELFGAKEKWVPARDIIDWSDPGESIFERKKPLSPNTLRRIAVGLQRYGIRPFVLQQQSGGAPRLTDLPLAALSTAGAQQLITPFILKINGGNDKYTRTRTIDQSLATLTGKPAQAIVQPFVISRSHTGANGSYTYPTDRPFPTLTTQDEHVVIQPFLISYHGSGKTCHDINRPIPTLDTRDRYAVIVPGVGEFGLDIRYRLIKSSEMAAAHGLGHYDWGEASETTRKKMIGNSVPSHTATALCQMILE